MDSDMFIEDLFFYMGNMRGVTMVIVLGRAGEDRANLSSLIVTGAEAQTQSKKSLQQPQHKDFNKVGTQQKDKSEGRRDPDLNKTKLCVLGERHKDTGLENKIKRAFNDIRRT